MIVNKYPGSCSSCSTQLKRGEGFVFKHPSTGKWIGVCQGRQCVEKVCPAIEVKSYERHMEKSKTRRLCADGRIEMPYELASLPLVRAMPGARFDYEGSKQWFVSTEAEDRRRVIEIARKINLDIDAELLTVDVPDHIKRIKTRIGRSKLYAFQKDGADWLAEQENCLLADEMGLGKTLQMLMAMDEQYGHFVACPTQCVYTWLEEGMKWRPDLEYYIVKSKKTFKIPAPGQVVIVSHGTLPEWLAPEKGKRKNNSITKKQVQALAQCIAIYDECHELSNPKTHKARRAKYLSRMCRRAIGLTGSPVRNRPLELWNILVALDCAERVFDSFIKFIKLFNGKKGRFAWEFPEKLEVDPSVPERLRRVMMRRLKRDYLKELPSKRYQIINIDGDKKITKLLDTAYEVYTHTAKKAGKIDHELGEISKAKAAIAKAHFPTTLAEVEKYEAADTPIIVVSCHRYPVEMLAKRKGWACLIGGQSQKKKKEIVDEFQAGKLKGLAVSLGAATTGITLTYGSDVIRNDLDWVPANNHQFEDRIHRIGQNKACIYKDVVSDHPLVHHIHKLNARKIELANDALEKLVAVSAPTEPDKALADTEEDYRARVIESKRVENEKRRDAILVHMDNWLARISISDIPPPTPARTSAIKAAGTTMMEVSRRPRVRRQGKISSSEFSAEHEQIMSLLLLAGMETENELRLAEAILLHYEGVLGKNHPTLFVGADRQVG